MTEWIKCSDRMPEHGCRVRLRTGNGHEVEGHLCPQTGTKWVTDEGTCGTTDPTTLFGMPVLWVPYPLWQPLPAPPEVE